MPQLDWTQIGSFLMPILLLVFMVVVLIIPQKKQEKKIKAMLDAVKPGDYIRTIGGIYGTIVDIKGSLMMIETGPDKVKMVFSKSAISTVENADVEQDM